MDDIQEYYKDYNNLTCELIDKVEKHDISFKLILFGNAGVGKTSLTNAATNSNFSDSYKTTLGFEFSSINYKFENKIVKLQIWDTCGQEIYQSIISNFYRTSSLAFLVYSINELETWLSESKNYTDEHLKIFLIGNKSDLEMQRKVTYEEALEFQKKHQIDYFTETSAKLGQINLDIFTRAAKILYSEYLKYKKFYDSSNFNSFGNFKSTDTRNSRNSLRIVHDQQVIESTEIKNGTNCFC